MLMAVYDAAPVTHISDADVAWRGYDELVAKLRDRFSKMEGDNRVLVIECYPAVNLAEIQQGLIEPLQPNRVVCSDKLSKPTSSIEEMLSDYLTDDRVFGVMSHLTVDSFFDETLLATARQSVGDDGGLTIIYGTGASYVWPSADILVYVDVNRWEIQKRYRTEKVGNWLANNFHEEILRKVKRGYFVDWRVADRIKFSLMDRVDYWIDSNLPNDPHIVAGKDYRAGLRQLSRRPFRLVPYFDASVWGGHWMEKQFHLPKADKNYGWAFDGVPEENSIRLEFGNVIVDTPAMNIVHYCPSDLLGPRVYSRFGPEFPIRFDFLDTWGGGNLSLQVHPLTGYIQDHFGMNYTQDESYYILDATDHSSVYLGVKNNTDKSEMFDALQGSETGDTAFPDQKFVNRFPVKKHDHVSIPAGTIHCGGADTVILEISATPYIFTFKLWDWGRIGLDGRPRPIHLTHGKPNVVIERDEDWSKKHLLAEPEILAKGDGYQVEKTGLNDLEFIETHRYWFTKPITVETHSSVNMLNLVEGESATVESLNNEFPPFLIHYGETFIVPEAVQKYRVIPSDNTTSKCGLLQAYVRS